MRILLCAPRSLQNETDKGNVLYHVGGLYNGKTSVSGLMGKCCALK